MLSFQTILPHTLELLKQIMAIPLFGSLRLVGGTALALQYGHRTSIDLDFFGDLEEDTEIVTKELEQVGVIVRGSCSQNIKAYRIDGVKIDFVNYSRYPWIDDPVIEDGILLASPKDIAAMKVNAIQDLLMANNALDIIKEYDFIIDGTDNFPVKFLINDACVMAGKPFSHGGILRFEGQTFTHVPGSACYRCVFGAPPPNLVPTCSQAGVLGAIAGMLGTIQAAEALKYITGVGELLTNQLLTFNAKTMDFRKVKTRHNSHCKLCGDNPTIHELIDYEQAVCDLKNH